MVSSTIVEKYVRAGFHVVIDFCSVVKISPNLNCYQRFLHCTEIDQLYRNRPITVKEHFFLFYIFFCTSEGEH